MSSNVLIQGIFGHTALQVKINMLGSIELLIIIVCVILNIRFTKGLISPPSIHTYDPSNIQPIILGLCFAHSNYKSLSVNEQYITILYYL
jgi:hypothetical protein